MGKVSEHFRQPAPPKKAELAAKLQHSRPAAVQRRTEESKSRASLEQSVNCLLVPRFHFLEVDHQERVSRYIVREGNDRVRRTFALDAGHAGDDIVTMERREMRIEGRQALAGPARLLLCVFSLVALCSEFTSSRLPADRPVDRCQARLSAPRRYARTIPPASFSGALDTST